VPSQFSSTQVNPAAGGWVNLMGVQSSVVGSGWDTTLLPRMLLLVILRVGARLDKPWLDSAD